ncbi:sperm tail-domain-containing protein [Gorgonomyces haynaldii]|nr:sperm tail-domain-containing protein [Gorgonomyces haynaldii]
MEEHQEEPLVEETDPQQAQEAHQQVDGSREARIALRKQRIEQARLAKNKPLQNQDDILLRRVKKTEPEQRNAGKSKSQIAISTKQLNQVKENGAELVSNIRVGVTLREMVRRQEEVTKVDVWKRKRDEELVKSGEMIQEIEKEWQRMEQLSSPYQLSELLVKQKQQCQQLLQIKNKLISEYVAELKTKDDEYVRELKRQSEEIDALLERMDTEFKNYQKTLAGEFEQIERAFVEERQELIETNSTELEQLFEMRRQNEARYMQERSDRIEEHNKQLEQLRVHDAEEYNLVKIKLETDVQVLEQQLRQMRATYQLNGEKLEYNLQVLKKREEENGTILGAQKRKINRLTDHLNALKVKTAKQEKQFSQENASLTDDYKHLAEQYKELQKKFRHFKYTDNKKFKEIWRMNEESAKELMRKLLQADRIIYEQQLGLDWQQPQNDLFRNIDPDFFKNQEDDDLEIEKAQEEYEQELDKKLVSASNSQDPEKRESLAAKFQSKKNSKSVKRILELLCNEAGFLVEDKLQKLLAPLHKDEQSLMRLDSIFKALAVETIDDIERLTSYFVQETISKDEVKLIHPDNVVKSIRKFVDDSRGHKSKRKDTDEDQFVEKESNAKQETEENSTRIKKLQKQYWTRIQDVISDKSYRTWLSVYRGMQKYNQILTQRYHLSQEISSIKHQNDELKALLRQYMSARVNDELQIPPTQIMLAQAGMLRGQ